MNKHTPQLKSLDLVNQTKRIWKHLLFEEYRDLGDGFPIYLNEQRNEEFLNKMVEISTSSGNLTVFEFVRVIANIYNNMNPVIYHARQNLFFNSYKPTSLKIPIILQRIEEQARQAINLLKKTYGEQIQALENQFKIEIKKLDDDEIVLSLKIRQESKIPTNSNESDEELETLFASILNRLVGLGVAVKISSLKKIADLREAVLKIWNDIKTDRFNLLVYKEIMKVIRPLQCYQFGKEDTLDSSGIEIPKVLKNLGFQCYSTKGDGNCFYNAISQHLFGTTKLYSNLLRIVSFLFFLEGPSGWGETLSNYETSPSLITGFLNHIIHDCDQAFAEHLTLHANALQHNIYLFSNGNQPFFATNINEPQNGNPILIGHRGNEHSGHYVSIGHTKFNGIPIRFPPSTDTLIESGIWMSNNSNLKI